MKQIPARGRQVEFAWLYLLPLAAFPFIHWGLDFNGLYGQDSHWYYQFSQAIETSFSAPQDLSPYRIPPLYPSLGALGSQLGFSIGLILQLLSCLALIATAWFTDRIIRLHYPAENRPHYLLPVYICLALILSPFMLRGAYLIMTDLMAVGLSTASIYFYLKFRESSSVRDLGLLIVLAAFAFQTRSAVALVLFLPGLDAVRLMFIRRNYLPLLLSVGLVLLAFIPFFLIKSASPNEFSGHHLLASWSSLNWFRSSFVGLDGTVENSLINLATVFDHLFHPAYIWFGLPLLFFVKKSDFAKRPFLILIAAVLIYSLFIAGLNFQNRRYLMLSFPLVVVLLFPAFERGMYWLDKPWRIPVILLIASLQLPLFAYAFQKFYHLNQTEKALAHTVSQYPPTQLYTFVVTQALDSYQVPHQVISLYDERIADFPAQSLILVNIPQWKEQWQGRNPMLNWEFAREAEQLEKLEGFAGGWELYRVR